MALIGSLEAELLGRAVKWRRHRVAVDVEELAWSQAPGDAVGAGRGGEALAAFVARDDGGADVVVLIGGADPLAGGADPLGGEDPEGALAVVVAGNEDPFVVIPFAAGPAAVDAVTGGDHDAEVRRVDRGPRAAGEPFAVTEDDEDGAVLAVAGKGGFGDGRKVELARAAGSEAATLRRAAAGVRGGVR